MLPLMMMATQSSDSVEDLVRNRIEAGVMLHRSFGGDQYSEYWKTAKELISCWRTYLELKEVRDKLGDWTTDGYALGVIDKRYNGNFTSFYNHLDYARGQVKIALELFDRIASLNGKESVSKEWLEMHLDVELCKVLERRLNWYIRYHKAPVMLSKLI